MIKIDIATAHAYSVNIGSGLLLTLAQEVKAHTKAEKVCIVSDCHVFPLYGETVKKVLEDAGYHTASLIFPAGEAQKNGSTYLQLLEFLADNGLSRSDCIIALGGGVVGDLAGFAAATYLRGIAYIQVPTTLLAMVDSSVGGKTGIDLQAGKNLAGAFYQPAAVICDTDTLRTLPGEVFRDGCAEVIKYAVLFDPQLFAALEEYGTEFQREAVIARCVDHKKNIVVHDELDKGLRRLLNFGHTIGHAIEVCSHYEISHGRAVSIGMSVICRSAKCKDAARITALLAAFGLPVTTEFSADALCEAALSDKKRHGKTVDLVIADRIGSCDVIPAPVEKLKTFIEEGL